MASPTLARTATGAVRIPMTLATGIDVVSLGIYHRLRTEVGTALEDAARGLPWTAWLMRQPVPLVEVEAQVRAQLRRVPGVVTVEAVTAARASDGAITCTARCTVAAGGEAYSLSVQVADPYQTSGPPLLFQILPPAP